MPLQETSGAASYDAFGGGPPFEPVYIESVFSTWLYTGNGSTQTITNGIDLAGKGGLVWIKRRDSSNGNRLNDTARGVETSLSTNNTLGNNTGETTGLTAFSASGFTVGSDPNYNTSSGTYASWTFRKQAKFFDVVTYTGNGVSGRTVAHSLGSVPGCIIVKGTSVSGCNWAVYHRSAGASNYLLLNEADVANPDFGTYWGNANPTSTNFSVGSATDVNQNGTTYVAYLFAHDAGGFGLTGADNVISCGSYTGTGSAGNAITLGYEPQWVLIKRTDSTGNWNMTDTMRQMSLTNNLVLYSNLSNAEFDAGSPIVYPTATGFTCGTGSAGWNASGGTYIYIAIRRGPMKTPTSGTSVFTPITYTGTGTTRAITSPGFPVDFVESKTRNATYNDGWFDRLRGATKKLSAVSTGAEITQSDSLTGFDSMTGYSLGADAAGGSVNESSINYVNWAFRRAPGFFDVVCYTGTGVIRTVNHNLGVVPELMLIKHRTLILGDPAFNQEWAVYASALGATKYVQLNTTGAAITSSSLWDNTAPTSSVFSVGTASRVNHSTASYVAYLFASCPGVSKVGSYTGSGTTKQIDCGFTGGARFVLIKRTDSTGDWYVWDSARGIVSGNDPYLLLNSTAAEVTSTDYIDTYSAGFEISSTAPAAINANGGSYIYLAIA